MKIAVIGQRYNPFKNDIVLGGSEMVEKSHLKLLGEFCGNDVHFLTSENSETANFKNVTTHKLNSPSKFFQEEKQNIKERSRSVRECLLKINPDFIVCHDDVTGFLFESFKDIAPSILFMHCPAKIHGLLSIGYVNNYMKAAERSLLVGVSRQSNIEWNEFIQSSSLISKKSIISEFMYPAITWSLPPIKEGVSKTGVMAGRLVKQKRHELTESLFRQANVPLTTFYPGVKTESELDILNKLKYTSLREGIEHHEIIELFASSMVLSVCGEESFGLTAYEANSVGTPVILLSTKQHAVEEATCEEGLILCKTKKEFVDVLSSMSPYRQEKRDYIRDSSWKKFNPGAASDRFNSIFIKAKEKFNQTEPDNCIQFE